ncbi:MAG: hypothetical protein QF918_08315 [Pirellulaceae bacterium]|nr:hypothetical protein [Pirellulaceae bacterium]
MKTSFDAILVQDNIDHNRYVTSLDCNTLDFTVLDWQPIKTIDHAHHQTG